MAKIIITIEDTSEHSIVVEDEGDTITEPTEESTIAQLFAWFVMNVIELKVFETGGKLMVRKD